MIDLPPAGWRLRADMAVNAFRWSLSRRIVSQVGPQSGGIAAAMVTGHGVWITAQQNEAMRASGLAHILSISGLHMAIVGGFVFAGFRVLLALTPWISLRFPAKKIAAGCGLAAVLVYLVVSGAPPPAERAAITASVAFIAVLFDRRAVSLHTLSLAALMVLALQPQAAAQPGFQMSFAATTALIALAEAWPRAPREISAPWIVRAAQAAKAGLVLSVGVGFVAGLATSPFAIQHFNRVAMWGLPANLAVEPLSTFVIMPFLAVGAVLEPLGLGGPFLKVAGWGVEMMQRIGEAAADAPGAVRVVASAPNAVLPVSLLGLMLLCLWRGGLRWVGLPMMLAVFLWPRPAAPDVWIAPDGGAAAVRRGGQAILLRPGVRTFASELWMRRRGLTPSDETDAYACKRTQCLPTPDAPVRVAAHWGLKPLAAEKLIPLCEDADLVILRSDRPEAPPECEGRLILDAADFQAGGAAELYRTADGWRIVWAQDRRGHRPWTAPISDNDE